MDFLLKGQDIGFLNFYYYFRSSHKSMYVGTGFLVIFILLEDKTIKDLTVDVLRWCMKMDYGKHPIFNKIFLVSL